MRIGSQRAAAAAVGLVLAAMPGAARADAPGLLALGIGAYDITDGNRTAALFRMEYRFATSFLWILKPMIGASTTTDRTFFAYGGLRIEATLANHVVVMADTAAGYWHHGRGLDLGNALEFKSGVELAWRFTDNSRLGIAFDHISNAGIAKLNPGVQSLLLVYSFPLCGAQ